MAWVADSPSLLDTELTIDKPLDFQKARDLRDRDSYLFDSAMRGGTFTTPHRFAYASGTKTFSLTLASGVITGSQTITFADDCSEGDPNFGAAPRVFIGIEEDSSGSGIAWGSNNIQVTVTMDNGSLATTGVDLEILIYDPGSSSSLVEGIIHWHAIGDPTSGE